MNGIPWSPEERDTFRRLRAAGWSIPAIAAEIGRPLESTKTHAKQMRHREEQDLAAAIRRRSARFVEDGRALLVARG